MSPTLELASAVPRKLHGYDAETVEALVGDVTAAREELVADCARLRAEVERLRTELAGRGDVDRAIREIFVSAQREADAMRAAATVEAEAIREEARQRAQGADTWFDDEADRIRAGIAQIHALEEELCAITRMLLLEAMRRLDAGEEAEREPLGGPAAISIEVPPAAGPSAGEPPEPEPDPAAVSEAEPEPDAPPEEKPHSLEADTIAAPAAALGGAAGAATAPAPPAHPEPPAVEEDTTDIPVVEPATERELEPEELAAEPATPAHEPPGEPSAPSRAFPLRAALAAIGILVAGAAIAVLIWQLRSDDGPAAVTVTVETAVATQTVGAQPANPPATAPETQATAPAETESATAAGETTAETVETATAPETAAATEQGPETAAPPPSVGVTLVLRAAGGDCWVSVRRGSADGKLLYEGFLFDGDQRRFRAEQVWMRVGNPTNLVARLNGKPLSGLPSGTADVLVTRDGAETLALG